jgi:adenosylcobinamide-GDP ribazoletransferase
VKKGRVILCGQAEEGTMKKKFLNALQFLTILTVNRNHELEEGDLAKSMVYFPVVGFLIGFVLVNADKLLTLIVLPHTIINILLIAITVLITRALHIDGLADTFDGLMGGNSAQSRLAIMKDSRLGTAGALSLFFVLTIKYLCLNGLFNSEKVAVLLTAPTLARWSQTLMAYNTSYGREEGMGRVFVGHLRSSGLVAASATAVGLTAFVIVREEARTVLLAFSLIGGVVLFTLLAKRYLVSKLGGVTGDAIGAVSELNEVLVCLIFVILSSGS